MTTLAIRVRESRVALATTEPGRLVVEVPREPLKADRGTVVFPWVAGTTDRMVLKVYGDMGFLNWMRKQVVGYRARREFRALQRLRDAGIACCEPMFWGTGRSPEHGLFEVVATREIPNAATLAQRMPTLAAATRGELLGRLFEALGRTHRAGVFHGAFFLANVLVGSDAAIAGVPWLIDLEKSICFGTDIRGTRMADYDLLDGLNSTFFVMGSGYARGALERYGLDQGAVARVFAALERTKSSKFGRYRRRAEFLARGILSRLAAELRSTPPTPELDTRATAAQLTAPVDDVSRN